jgi:uncharacterized membrane protein YccC
MSQPSSFWVRHAALVFSLRTFAAAMLAFGIALRLDMPRPYWAMASVYITSNQLAGATWSKAAYRMLGTLIGAAATIALIPNLVDAPELLSLAIALWVGLCLYLSLIDGTPRGYVFMLAGYTVALLGFPVLSTPELTFDLVVSRVQEIMLGIVCASIVSVLVLPRSVAATISAKADAWLANARRLGADVLSGRGSDQQRDDERMRLAAAASEIDQLGRHLDYETDTSANTARGLRLLRQRMLMLLPLLASIEQQGLMLNAHGEMPPELAELLTKAARWLADGGHDGEEAAGLRAALDEVQPQPGIDAGWSEIVAAAFVVRLCTLMDILRDCGLLRAAIADGRDPDSLALAFTTDASSPATLHRDHVHALWAAAATAVSVLACCAFWIATGWGDGATAPIFAAVLGSLLAGVDDPLPAYRGFYKVFLGLIAINGIYTFGVLPQITTFEMLVVALMPTFVLFGWMAVRPATAQAGSFLAIFLSVQLALNSSYEADFSSFANSSVALMLGVGLTGVVNGIVRLFGSGWVADRLLRSNWKTLAAVAESTDAHDRVTLAGLMQHRLALLAARIAVVPAEARSSAANLRQLRAALSLIDLEQASVGLSRRTRATIAAFLAQLASVCRAHHAGQLPDELVGRLDGTIAFTLQEPASEHRGRALVGLTGVRAGLFPGAAPYQPNTHQQGRVAA